MGDLRYKGQNPDDSDSEKVSRGMAVMIGQRNISRWTKILEVWPI